MIEYKYVQLEDTIDSEAESLKRVVDGLEPILRKYIYSIRKEEDSLILEWNRWKPSGADRGRFQERVCAISGAHTCTNVVTAQFKLPPSLHAALQEVANSETAKNRCSVALDHLDHLHMWGLVNVDYEYDYIGQAHESPSEGVIFFSKILKQTSLTALGNKYLNQGYLDDLPKS